MGVPAVLRAAWADFFVEGHQSHDEYILSEEESAAKVAFFAQKPLKNFRVLNLEFVDADEDGNVLFQTKSMYKQKELMPVARWSCREYFTAASQTGVFPMRTKQEKSGHIPYR